MNPKNAYDALAIQTKANLLILHQDFFMRILVIHWAGFVGSHLCERLVKEGHVVTAFENFPTG